MKAAAQVPIAYRPSPPIHLHHPTMPHTTRGPKAVYACSAVTLCIAAKCWGDLYRIPQPEVVVATDWRVENDSFSAETQHKIEFIHHNWIALFAGPVSQAKELI